MSSPDLTTYKQLNNGYFIKVSDLSGPYVWDCTTVELVDSDAGIVSRNSAH